MLALLEGKGGRIEVAQRVLPRRLGERPVFFSLYGSTIGNLVLGIAMGNHFCGTADAYWAARRLNVDTRSLMLSPEAEEALHKFGSASLFPQHPRLLPDEVRWLQIVWREANAGHALWTVLHHGTLVGQLLALAALRDVNEAAYCSALPSFRGRSDHVAVASGRGGPTAATIVERPDAVQLAGPADDVWQWSQRNPGRFIELDIAGGGYTSELRPTSSSVAAKSKAPDRCVTVESAWVEDRHLVLHIISTASAGGTPFVSEPIFGSLNNSFSTHVTTGEVPHLSAVDIPKGPFVDLDERETPPLTVVHEAARPAAQERWVLLRDLEPRLSYEVEFALEGCYEPVSFSFFVRRLGGHVFTDGDVLKK